MTYSGAVAQPFGRTFREVRSFAADAIQTEQGWAAAPAATPFRSVYESDPDGAGDPAAEAFALVVNELYDESFDDVLSEVVGEASELYRSQVAAGGGFHSSAEQGARMLARHFEPLAASAEAMIGAVSAELDGHDCRTLTDRQIDDAVDRHQPTDLSPSFEQFFGKIMNAVKRVTKVGADLARRGIGAVAKLGLGPILAKIQALVRPLLERVLRLAISRLPAALQPVARKLAERLPLVKEVEPGDDLGDAAVAEVQHEFNYQLAGLITGASEVEQDLSVARAMADGQRPAVDLLADLDDARERFITRLEDLADGEDPRPAIEEFIPALLPVLRIGVKIARPAIVSGLAKALGKLIAPFVGPTHTPALSRAIVDAGLKLLSLETDQDADRSPAAAVVATVEEAVGRLADLPEYALDEPDLIEGFVLEAFEKSAAANLPPGLPAETYRRRPDLIEASTVRGMWVPIRRGGRARYKRFSRPIRIKVTPHKAASVLSFGGAPVAEFLEEQLGIAPGDTIDATAHLFESLPGFSVRDLAGQERDTTGLGHRDAYVQLHPLTREAAGVLLGEPGLGRDVEPAQLASPDAADVGQRFYYLEIPAKAPLMSAPAGAPRAVRRRSRVSVKLDFKGNRIHVDVYLSEVRTQEIAVGLRRQGSVVAAIRNLRRIVERGVSSALSGGFGRLRIVHEAVVPGRWAAALQRLPSLATQILIDRIQEWILRGLPALLKQHANELVAKADLADDGITLRFTLDQPPGFVHVREALKGRIASLAHLRLTGGAPAVTLHITPGLSHD